MKTQERIKQTVSVQPPRVLNPGFLFVVILVIAVVIRAACTMDEMWLDEIWSFVNVMKLRSIAQVFTSIHQDNNNYIISMWMYLVGSSRHWDVYRIPSVAAGSLAVVYAWLICKERGTTSGLLGSFLFGCSYLVIHYSTEARGYAFCILSVLAATYHMRKCADRWSPIHLAAYVAACALGALSHLTFTVFVFAAFVWVVLRIRGIGGERLSWKPGIGFIATPMILYAALWLVDLRYAGVGGADQRNLLETLCSVGGYVFGLHGKVVEPLGLGVCLTIAVWMLRREFVASAADGMFYAIMLFAVPIIALFARTYPFQERHFLIPVAALLLLSAMSIPSVECRQWRFVPILLLLLWIVGNGLGSFKLMTVGRGEYYEALSDIYSHTTERVTTIGSDHDFRNGMLVWYYNRWIPRNKLLRYVPDSEANSHSPEWFIRHSIDSMDVQQATRNPQGVTYRLYKTYPSCGLSGFWWYLYRRS